MARSPKATPSLTIFQSVFSLKVALLRLSFRYSYLPLSDQVGSGVNRGLPNAKLSGEIVINF